MSEERERLRRAVGAVVIEARAHALDIEASGRWLPKHPRHPRLDHFDSGLPKVARDEELTQWSGLFGGASWHTMRTEDLDGHGELLDALEAVPVAIDRLTFPVDDPIRTQFARLLFVSLVLGLFDRLMHLHGHDFTEEDISQEWEPLERWLTSQEPLPARLVVPLPMTSCEGEGPHELAPGIRIEPIAEGEQLVRVPETVFFGQVNPVVLAAATHAIVFDEVEVPAGQLPIHAQGTARDLADASRVERVIQALRIASGLPLGYAQMYLRPLGWASRYTAGLPTVQGEVPVRRYPPSFDDYRWLRPAQVLTAEHLTVAVEVLTALETATPRLKMAARRLGQAQLRDDEDDAVLDACIALEAAVGDSAASEMRHKVSMRTAVLLGEAGGDAERIVKAVKAMYDWRSSIVHGGDHTKARKAFAAHLDADERLAGGLAIKVASQAVRVMLVHPEIGEGKDIDLRMLPGRT